ncbi:unnamed protein product [Echinostoma caproni]|uniref:Uncharacterized protein n=1 Tax=Echinostoma caproni TaxID=27848 RepID=A0A183BAG2_9TREM|nr:unnamed protein product [Echinostoma caproni]
MQLKRSKRKTFEEKQKADLVKAPKRLFAYLKRRTRDRDGIPSLIDGVDTVDFDEGKAEALTTQSRSVDTRDAGSPPTAIRTATKSFQK